LFFLIFLLTLFLSSSIHISPLLALFANGRVVCFGSGASGILGTGSTANVASAAAQPGIPFSAADAIVSEIALAASHACVVRCNGQVLCFGSNTYGELALGSAAVAYGDQPTHMSLLKPIGFDPAKVPFTPTGRCTATLLALTESSGSLGFQPGKTFYLFTVGATVEIWTLLTATPSPAQATVTLNGDGLLASSASVALDLGLNEVNMKSILVDQR
jgi:hypothetical protein